MSLYIDGVIENDQNQFNGDVEISSTTMRVIHPFQPLNISCYLCFNISKRRNDEMMEWRPV